ncbi:LysR family transcriptional regulator [Cronobacter sakazakii]|nr:LysR family transcriptional regulator [Cronobacter sakazakii]EJO9494034.1 LysR family transcriptional regulator [Cronobacter sakazakii]EJP5817898.1 LysR family transcriptional regulator [Cronobacter sakazakii]EJP5827301.1 LysR family transcriptional regulator [Cronobacter sakazakii]EJQ8006480.1 LysR family transcriptional regulator [Cronobacter sakazakii]
MNESGAVNIRALQLFISVFDGQSFSAVARREGVSASMISRTVRQLEEALGQQLFYRNTRAVIPTEAGRLFAQYARGITEQFSEARRELQDRSLEPSGLLRINAPVFFGQRHIAPWLTGLAERYPRLQLALTQTDDYVDPHRDATDLIVRIGTLTDSSFHARVFCEQRYYFAAAPEELQAHQCLVYSGSSGPNRWLARKPGEPWVHYPVNARLVSNNAHSLLTAALDGMGLVLFPDWMTGEWLAQGRLVKVLPEYEAAINTEAQHIAAIYPNARHPPLNVRSAIDYFVEVFGTPVYWQRD